MSNLTPGDGFTMDVKLHPDSLNYLTSFTGYQAHLEPALSIAMEKGISMLQAYATDFMYSHFQNPTGPLEEDFWEVDTQGPYLTILSNTAPYSQRRNYGFSNMTDALGRYYAHDPGIGWAELTLYYEKIKILDTFQAAVDYANLQLGRSAP